MSLVKKILLAGALTFNANATEPYARTLHTKNPNGKGTIYLIGQQHFYNGTKQVGDKSISKQPKETVHCQNNIFHLLLKLNKQQGVKLVFGEGFNKGEMKIPYQNKGMSENSFKIHANGMQNYNFSRNFFKLNPREVGYAATEIFYPEQYDSWGLERKELFAKTKAADRALFQLVDENTSYKSPQERAKFFNTFEYIAKLNITQRIKDEVKDKRSDIYIQESQIIADKRNEDNFAIVIGSAHLPRMIENYSGNRKLIVLQPYRRTF